MSNFKLISRGIKLLAVGIILMNTASAQLKLYNNGSISIGSITQPPVNMELQVVGNSVFSQNTSTVVSGAFIKGLNFYSSDTNPDYTWMNDTKTGMYHPDLSTLAFTVAGVPEMIFSPYADIMVDSTIDNGDKFQVNCKLNQNPLSIYSHTTINYVYSGVNWVNSNTTKAWVLRNGSQEEFYVYGNGQAYAYGWNQISDSTLKENVTPIQNALSKVLQLNGVTYNFKMNNATASVSKDLVMYTSPRQIGLIAQAVERVVPEVVSTNDNGIKTIEYSNMVGLLVEAMKQEDLKVNTLQHQLDSCFAVCGTSNGGASLAACSATPANTNITFSCFVPEQSKSASIMVFDMSGKLKKTLSINGKQAQNVTLSKGELMAGMYYYTLLVDNNEVSTKKLILTDN